MSANSSQRPSDDAQTYEWTLLLDGMGGEVAAESEHEAKRKAIEHARDRLDDILEREKRRGSNAAQHFVRDLRPREQSVELHEMEDRR